MTELNITSFLGKTKRLRTAIEIAVLNNQETLPDVLVMLPEQYELLKRLPEMGTKDQYKYYPAEDRIYMTKLNAMEIRISDRVLLTNDDVSVIMTS